jgi:hypothetical protein
MTSGAQELLSILSLLPDGLADADLVQAKLPIPDILACKARINISKSWFQYENIFLASILPQLP